MGEVGTMRKRKMHLAGKGARRTRCGINLTPTVPKTNVTNKVTCKRCWATAVNEPSEPKPLIAPRSLLILPGTGNAAGIGNFNNKSGHVRVKVAKKYLKRALEFLFENLIQDYC